MRLLRQLWFVITRRRQEDELADELEFHRQMKADELSASGAPDAEVRARVQQALGNDLVAREQSRDVWIAPWFQDISQDVRFALRMMAKDRRFAITAIVTLGLGIGASNAAFSFVNAAMFRDLPFERSDRLITIKTDDPRGFLAGVSYREFREWQQHVTAVETMSAELSVSVNIGDDHLAADRLSGTFLTYPTFRVLGVAPVMGRDFTEDDDRDGAPPVAILSHALWTTRYGADPAIVGRTVRINSQPTTVIGVMPARFSYPLVADLWLPMATFPGIRNASWVATTFGVVGRLRDGAHIAEARAQVAAVAARTVLDHPEVKRDRRVVIVGVKESQLANGAGSLLWALLGAAVVVLLVASANVANLLMARSWGRAREIAVRIAIGASRWRVVRQVLIECFLIGVGGVILGAYASYFAFHAMASAFNILEFGAPDRPRKPYWFDPSIDGAGWLFMGVVFVSASLCAGLLPALHLSRTDANEVLKDGRDGQSTRASRRWAAVLMVGQIAVALMLLSVGGLFARNFLALYNTDPVIPVAGLISMQLTLPAQMSVRERQQFVRQLDERVAANREFAAASIATTVPLQMVAASSRVVAVDGEPDDTGQQPRSALYFGAGPRFFETLRFPVVHGRALADEDALAGREGVVVNQRFVTLFFGDRDPIGKRIRLTPAGGAPNPPPPWLTIVGVVPTIPDFLPKRPDDPAAYMPLLADPTPPRAISIVVRSASKDAAVAALRQEVSRLNDDLPVHAIQTMSEVLALTRMGARMIGSWFQSLALIAVTLASVGLYALVANTVAQRRREIGVRIALGAQANQVLWLFVRQTFVLLAIGIVIGLGAAMLLSGLLVSFFLGDVSPRDPVTLGTVAIVLSVIALAAGLGPARRATRVDPTVVLRAD